MKRSIRNLKITSSFFLLVFALTINVSAVAQVMALDSVIFYIEKNNPMLLEYSARARAQDEYASGAKSWMAPMVGVGPYWVPYRDAGKQGMYMAQVEQDIPNPAKQKAKKQYALSKGKVELEARAYQFNQLRAEAKELYYNAVVAQRQLAVLEENKQTVEVMLKLARIRYPYSQGTLGSIYKAEARLHEIENMRFMTQGEIDQSLVRLKSLMNFDESRTIAVDTSIQIRFIPRSSYDTADLVSVRSDVRQIDKTIEVMRLNQKVQLTSAKPDFRLRFEHMKPRDSAMPNMYSAMAMISIPIAPWSSRMYKSEVRGMTAEIEAMKRGREALLVETKGMLSSMEIQLTRMEQQLENYRIRILPALRKNYETTILAYEENREQLPVVIDAWEASNMAQSEYLNKQREYYAMIVTYEKNLEK